MIAAYGEHVVMRETLAEALSALFAEPGAAGGSLQRGGRNRPATSPSASQAQQALDHYNQAVERLKSGDWKGFGKEIGVMRGLLEDIRRQSGSR